VLNSPLVLVARTDAEAATMIDSNIAARRGTGLPGQGEKWENPQRSFWGINSIPNIVKACQRMSFWYFWYFLEFLHHHHVNAWDLSQFLMW
jgi:isocitrate lyase